MQPWGLSLLLLSSFAAAADENVLAKLKPIGAVSSYTKSDNAVTITCADASQVRVSILAPDLVRVRAAFTKALPERDHSWAIARTSWDAAKFSVSEASDIITISTSELDVVVHRSPLRIEFRDAATHRTILADSGPMHYDPNGRTVAATKTLGLDEHFYGLGEKAARLDKRRGQFTMWSSDTPGYKEGRDPIYQSIPFYIGLNAAKGGSTAYGVFFDNSYRTHFDFGATTQEYISFSAEGGEMNYYFFWGPQIAKVVERYSDLTGHMPMPPIWALGHQQSRYSYYPDTLAEQIVERYRADDLPLDVLHLDIHYMDGYRVFTWDPKRFPDPAGFTARLKAQGVKVVTIVDPGVKYQPQGYSVYEEGARNNYFLKRADGSLYIGEVWPGLSVFVDYTLPAAARWWGDLFRAYTNVGVAGIWTDMNEPADFIDQKGESQWNVVSYDDGENSLHAKNRNVFALGMARATYEGLHRALPGERPFVITRSGYAGIQRYSTMWTGDNDSTWESLALTIPMFQTLGLSGQPFVGGDIGGFMGNGNAELLTRWYEAGFLTPFCRNHKDIHGYDHEPWRFGPAYEDIIRKYLKLRYRLMPYLYTQIEDAHRTGLPVFRPLLFEDQGDLNTLNLDDEFMIGHDLLLAPVLHPGMEKRRVYLPYGVWVDYWTGKRYEGRRFIVADAPLETVPLYVRAGAILPMGPERNFLTEQPDLPITYDIFPDPLGMAATSLYEDDGHSEAYEKGAFRRTSVDVLPSSGATEIRISKPVGSYAAARRPLVFQLQQETVPSGVTLDGKPLTRSKPDATSAGWYVANHHLAVRIQDDSGAHVIRIKP